MIPLRLRNTALALLASSLLLSGCVAAGSPYYGPYTTGVQASQSPANASSQPQVSQAQTQVIVPVAPPAYYYAPPVAPVIVAPFYAPYGGWGWGGGYGWRGCGYGWGRCR